MNMEQRALRNPFRDYEGSPACAEGLFDSAGRLTPDFTQYLRNKIGELLQEMEKGLKSADSGDCTSYTGWSGIALLYLHLYNVIEDPSYLQRALQHVGKSLSCLTKRWMTFLCGDAGPLAIAAVVYSKLQREKESEQCISQLLRWHSSVVKLESKVPDEMLYGRMGYLSSLVFVNEQFGQEKIPKQYIQQICNTVLISGENLSKKRNYASRSPLMYEWYQEYYVGAAHGLSGIYYFLMQVFGEDGYLQDALQCGEVIWQRGLLKKGYGLCHGAAGNAYGFLALYKLTQDLKYLYRACKFAEWCLDYGKHGCRTPDTPFSLFEGMAGTIYFLADLLQPMNAKFPTFEM
ncbi:glutathione S-transferase LANCL1 isoform X3 [Latimeria chalumnae]|uniref:glutathione S-transferase LANCL1 isoform X3 n=1 Tax=Latimeria chalumnae TaxID=7897 RepID=UPI0003C16F0D